jgi:hypothetical protein
MREELEREERYIKKQGSWEKENRSRRSTSILESLAKKPHPPLVRYFFLATQCHAPIEQKT